jgi:hypothetical protein
LMVLSLCIQIKGAIQLFENFATRDTSARCPISSLLSSAFHKALSNGHNSDMPLKLYNQNGLYSRSQEDITHFFLRPYQNGLNYTYFFSFFPFFFFSVLGIELRAVHRQGKHSIIKLRQARLRESSGLIKNI